MPSINVKPGQVWQDDCYYLNAETQKCERKFWLVLAVNAEGDPYTVVFTSKAHGLAEHPACSLGPPRAGYYVGVLGKPLSMESWADFANFKLFDLADLKSHIAQGRTNASALKIAPPLLCQILRCLLQSPDITRKEERILADTVAKLGCA